MKPLFTFTAISLCVAFSSEVSAQIPLPSWLHHHDSIEVNNFRMSMGVMGTQMSDSSGNEPGCEYPKGSGKHIGNMSSLWQAGKVNNTLQVAATTYPYTSFGTPCVNMPGSVNVLATMNDTTLAKRWSKIWKVKNATLQIFKALVGMGNTTAIESNAAFDDIRTWPAYGNQEASGFENASLYNDLLSGFKDYAPFVDVNQDGLYNWRDGDYPKMKGDEMTYQMYNDLGLLYTSFLPYLKTQTQLIIYAYKRGNVLDNILYFDYKIANFSEDTITDYRTSFFADLDIGYAFDDQIGFDTISRTGIMYNGNDSDMHYGKHIPAAGITLVKATNDQYPSFLTPPTFAYFHNVGSGPLSNPTTAIQFDRYMRGYDAHGFPYMSLYAPFAYHCMYPAGDRRIVVSTAPITFLPGRSINHVFALIATPPDTTSNCHNHTTLATIFTTADSARYYYYNEPLPILGWKEKTSLVDQIKVFPSPAKEWLHVQIPASMRAIEARILDVQSREISVQKLTGHGEVKINVAQLPAGIYLLQLQTDEGMLVKKFAKE